MGLLFRLIFKDERMDMQGMIFDFAIEISLLISVAGLLIELGCK